MIFHDVSLLAFIHPFPFHTRLHAERNGTKLQLESSYVLKTARDSTVAAALMKVVTADVLCRAIQEFDPQLRSIVRSDLLTLLQQDYSTRRVRYVLAELKKLTALKERQLALQVKWWPIFYFLC